MNEIPFLCSSWRLLTTMVGVNSKVNSLFILAFQNSTGVEQNFSLHELNPELQELTGASARVVMFSMLTLHMALYLSVHLY